MLNYQRDIDMHFVEENSKDGIFEESKVSIVLVSVRVDGSMKVCDGQHTIAILKSVDIQQLNVSLDMDLLNKKRMIGLVMRIPKDVDNQESAH